MTSTLNVLSLQRTWGWGERRIKWLMNSKVDIYIYVYKGTFK